MARFALQIYCTLQVGMKETDSVHLWLIQETIRILQQELWSPVANLWQFKQLGYVEHIVQ